MHTLILGGYMREVNAHKQKSNQTECESKTKSYKSDKKIITKNEQNMWYGRNMANCAQAEHILIGTQVECWLWGDDGASSPQE